MTGDNDKLEKLEKLEKLKLHSKDLTQDNIAKLRDLFPGCVTEAKDAKGALRLAVDFDQLRQELSDKIVEGPQERYQLNWPGKREALLAANAPIAKTLRPAREESVNFDATQNLFIEGDNLEALKLLQESYLGKVKMIYIDPPYNTGNDFIYEDDFAENADEFLKRSNQKGDSGERLVANTEANGRFHSDWLSMVASRIKLARNLLSDRGVLFLSIDENEIHNLRKLLDEVFGQDNFLFQVTLLCNPKGRSQDKFVANCHEYILGYSKGGLDKGDLNISRSNEEIAENYKLKDSKGPYRELELRNTHREFGRHNRKNLFYPFFVDLFGNVTLEEKAGSESVYPLWEDGFEGCWTWGLDTARANLAMIVPRQVKGRWKIFRKDYAIDDSGDSTKQVKSIWLEREFQTEKGQAVFNELFDAKDKLFQAPKSVSLLAQLLEMGTASDSLVLDFFAGSGSTAHATWMLNAKDGGNRNCISIQIDDATLTGSPAEKAGYSTISSLSKERIRRAGKKVLEGECHPNWNKDVGFRVLKIDTSNMNDVYYAPHELKQDQLDALVTTVKPDRKPEDLLFQVLIDWGVELSLPIARETIEGRQVFFVDGNGLAACFEHGVTEALVKEIAKRKPVRAVFRDDGFGRDDTKINVRQIFKQLSPNTEVKAI